jgi:spoIIIJ-associated protein
MYESRNEAREFIGSTRSEAVAKACSFFGAEEGELRVVDLDSESVAGLAGRQAIVAVPANAVRARQAPRERSERPERSDRPERSERMGRGDRPERGPERGRERDRDRDRDRGRGRERETARVEEEEAPAEDSIATVTGELSPIGEFVKGALERMNLGPFEVSESAEEDLVVVHLSGPGAGRLRSGESRAGEALQLLANQTMLRSDEPERRVVVDVEGDAEQRQVFLERIAERAARRAKETGRSVALEPMNGHDRRVIHVALRDAPDVATMSMGEGRYRQVVVVPQGAPEYEEARRSAASKE